jgi:hypothetical protein
MEQPRRNEQQQQEGERDDDGAAFDRPATVVAVARND